MDNFDFKKYLAENRIHADHDLINEKKEDSKKGNKEEQKRMEGAIRDNEIHIDKLNKDKKADKKKLAKLKADEPKDVSEAQGYNDRDDEAIGAKDGAEKDKKVSMKGRRDMSRGMEKAMGKRADSTDSKMDEAETQKEEMPSKLKVSELKAKIKEQILAELSLSEAEEEVDVDIDVEDEVEVEAGADDIEIERPGVKTTIDVGLSPEEEVVQDSLKAAMDAANDLGNQKLADQIGNTITFFTREFVVGQNTD